MGKTIRALPCHFKSKMSPTRERNSTNAVRPRPVENFITDLYRLAVFCEYGSLKQNRLVVGLKER